MDDINKECLDLKNKMYIENMKIDEIPWHRITTTYGRGTEFPIFFEILNKMENMEDVREALYNIKANIEHQSTFWHTTPFAIVFLCRTLEETLFKKDSEIANFITDEILKFFVDILEIYNEIDEMEHDEPLSYFSDLLNEEYLWSEYYDEEEDEIRYEEEEVFPYDLFYSFYYYSYLVITVFKDTLKNDMPKKFKENADAILSLL